MRKLIVSIFLTFILLPKSLVYLKNVEVTVNDLGLIVGKFEKSKWSKRDFYSFRGIPFAESPEGDLRYAPPVKISSWTDKYLDATNFRNICPQTKQPGYDVEGYDEDCLHLNLYVPRTNSEQQRLPVMIWIHGGYFMSGHAGRYGPDYLMESDVILVVPQFRLGPLGLLCLETEDIPGNVQFLDQIMAMEWVKDNIECFGGDRNSVTLFGQSSGGYSVNLHLLSPLSRGLFHRTIIQSNSIYTPGMIDRNPVKTANEFAKLLGCDVETVASTTKCLKTISVESMLKGFDKYIAKNSENGADSWGGNRPVVQKSDKQGVKFLTEEPSVLIDKGEFLKLPMIGGTTKQDGSLLVSGLYEALKKTGLLSDSEFLEVKLIPLALKIIAVVDETGSVSSLLKEKYFENNEFDDFLKMVPGLTDIGSLLLFKSGMNRMIYENSRFQPTYLYSFDYRGSETRFGYESDQIYEFDGGVAHSDENIYLFPFPDRLNERDTTVAKNLIKLWTSFAINETPVSESEVKKWPKVTQRNGPYLKISDVTKIGKNYADEYSASTIELKEAKSCGKKMTKHHNRWIVLMGLGLLFFTINN